MNFGFTDTQRKIYTYLVNEIMIIGRNLGKTTDGVNKGTVRLNRLYFEAIFIIYMSISPIKVGLYLRLDFNPEPSIA